MKGDRKRAIWSRVLLCSVCDLVVACGEEPRAPTELSILSAELPHIPQLGCFASVATIGSCGRDAECGSEHRCVFDRRASWEDRAPIPLTCDAAPGSKGASARCSAGGECQSGLCSLPGLCLQPCRTSPDCGEGRICRPIEVSVGDAMGPVMACARSLVLPDDVQLALGQGASDMRNGISSLSVPGTGDPSLIYVQSDCARSGFDILKLRSLDLARDVYNLATLQGGGRADNTILHDGSSLAAILFPDNPTLPAAQLGLLLDLKSSARQRADVVVASRRGTGRALDLNVFYVGGGVDVTGDPHGFRPGERRVAAMLDRLDARLREIGLALGEIREHEVVGALREELSVLDTPRSKVGGRMIEGRPQRLDELFRLSAGVDTVGINVFIIRDMGNYVGIAGGIPGVLGVHGSDRSGVAIAAELLGELLDADLVLMHELGHFLGLFHTTEGSGTVLDPLSDTAECGLDQDVDHDGELSTVECADHGADNLMFWSGVGSLLTTQQIAVMADSVIFR